MQLLLAWMGVGLLNQEALGPKLAVELKAAAELVGLASGDLAAATAAAVGALAAPADAVAAAGGGAEEDDRELVGGEGSWAAPKTCLRYLSKNSRWVGGWEG